MRVDFGSEREGENTRCVAADRVEQGPLAFLYVIFVLDRMVCLRIFNGSDVEPIEEVSMLCGE